MPGWASYHIAHQMVPDHLSIISEKESYNYTNPSLEFNYFYYNNTGWNKDNESLVSNNCLLPHTDPSYDRDTYILLFNLNKRKVSTCFWLYNGKRRVDSEDENTDLMEYTNSFNYDNFNDKMNEGIIQKQFCIEYDLNEAILYNANRLHSPIIDKHWTRENPRRMLRCLVEGYNYDN